MEVANVGVLLFCPERHFLKAITSSNNRRIQRFFGSADHDWRRLESFKKGIEERLVNEAGEIRKFEDLQSFIAQRANLLQITDPRPMKVTDPEADLKNLYTDLMGESPRNRIKKSFRQIIDEKLSRDDLQHKILRAIKVDVPVKQKQIEVPFGYLNGRFNLLNPVRFEAHRPDHSFETACKYAVEGRSIYQTRDPKYGPSQLVIIGRFRPKDDESPQIVKRVFDESHVRLVRLTEMPQLIDEIRLTGKDIT